MIRCQSCGAETSNGLALCDLCRRAAESCLEFIPVYTRNLSRWRPGRAGSRTVPGSREPRTIGASTAGDRVARALDETGSELVGYARQLEDARGIPQPEADDEAQQATRICDLLTEHLTSISTTDWAGDLVRDMQAIERRLSALTVAVVPGWYAGGCRQPAAFDEQGAVIRCGVPVYVIPGLTWVTCSGCGTTTYARDHLDVVLDEARDWVAPPKRVAEAVVALVDTEPSVPRLHDRIRKWESLGWVVAVRRADADGDPVGPKRYRMGDVLDLVHGHADAPTRAKRGVKAG